MRDKTITKRSKFLVNKGELDYQNLGLRNLVVNKTLKAKFRFSNKKFNFTKAHYIMIGNQFSHNSLRALLNNKTITFLNRSRILAKKKFSKKNKNIKNK